MDLPIADNIEPTRTGRRLPERSPAGLGLYAEQQGHPERDTLSARDVWRTEVRIGAQTAIDPRMPPERLETIHKDTKGMIMRHIYGPIYDETIKSVHDLFDSGLYRGDPAVDRLERMLGTLADAFRGDC